MKYKVKKVGDFENNIEIDIDFEDLESKKDEAISKISKSLKVKGFRPGKIPKNIVIREVGEDYILEESIDLYLPEQIFEILQKEELSPAVRPVVKDLKKEKKSYKVDVLITLWPKLSKLPKLNQTVEVESITPTEEEISDQIDRIKLQFADVTKVERPSKTSDYLLVNISAMENGKELEEFSYQDYLYELGSNSLTPSMDSKLEGVSTGAIIKFNDDIPSVGKSNVEITVLIKEIKEKSIVIKSPKGITEIDNDFVLAMTGYQPNYEILEKLGVNINVDEFKTPEYNEDTMETNVNGVYLAGVICGGLKTNKWFIENSRDHSEKIIKHIVKS